MGVYYSKMGLRAIQHSMTPSSPYVSPYSSIGPGGKTTTPGWPRNTKRPPSICRERITEGISIGEKGQRGSLKRVVALTVMGVRLESVEGRETIADPARL
jgi:hypothetical protein